MWNDAAGEPVGRRRVGDDELDGAGRGGGTALSTVTCTVPARKNALVVVAAPSSTPLEANGLMVSSVLAFFTPQRPVVVPGLQRPEPGSGDVGLGAVALVHTQPVLENMFSRNTASVGALAEAALLSP